MQGLIPPGSHPLAPQAPPPLAEPAWGAAAGGDSATDFASRLRLRRNAAQERTQGRPPRATPAILPAWLPGGLVMLTDFLAVALAGMGLAALPVAGERPEPALIALAALMVPALALVAGRVTLPVLFQWRQGWLGAFAAALAAIGGLWLVAAALGAHAALPTGIAALWLALSALLLTASRAGGAALLRRIASGMRQRAVLLVGDDVQAGRLVAHLRNRPDRAIEPIGFVVDDSPDAPYPLADVAAPPLGSLPAYGGLEGLFTLLRTGQVDQVVLALPWRDDARIARLVRLLQDYPVEVRLAPDLAAYRIAASGRRESDLVLPWLVEQPIRGINAAAKTVADYALALGALLLVLVPMGLIALAIRLESPGPLFFKQRRTGLKNRDFQVFKFRTMYHDAAACPDVIRQVTEGDPRITRVGGLLRRTSLDELPQLFNVLRGEMSFIGPRPHAPGTRAGKTLFEEVDPRYAARHRVKPGLTGLAQARGQRGRTDTEEMLLRRLESDLEYIDSWSLRLDLAILLRTLLAVARMKNAC